MTRHKKHLTFPCTCDMKANCVQLQHGDGTEPLQVSVSLAQSPDGSIQVINTEDGDTMHISAEALKSEPNEDSDQ